ncbi:MAG: DUF2231 domain-containing protein [Fidelibacterota bacterium]
MFPWEITSLHPLFIHFPIALLSTSVLFDILGVLFRNKSLHYAGWWCLLVGVISSLAAIATGFIADSIYGHMANPIPLFQTHGVVQLLASFMFIGLLIWRIKEKTELPVKPILFFYLGLSGVAVMILFYGAHLGAHLAGRF